MAKTNKNKNKNKFDKKNIAIAILVALNFLLVVVSVFVCSAIIANRLSEMDKEKIATHDFLTDMYLTDTCNKNMGKEHATCKIFEKGISKDGDLYVKFKYNVYNPETHQVIETGHRTLYFQHSDSSQYGYAMAMGE